MTSGELALIIYIWAIPVTFGLLFVVFYRDRPDGMTRF